MSQKTILSFFKHSEKSTKDSENSISGNSRKSGSAKKNSKDPESESSAIIDSPVKVHGKRKRVKNCIESDEDSDSDKIPTKVQLNKLKENGHCTIDDSEKMETEVSEDSSGNKMSKTKLSKKGKTEKAQTPSLGKSNDCSSVKAVKVQHKRRKQTESDEETSSTGDSTHETKIDDDAVTELDSQTNKPLETADGVAPLSPQPPPIKRKTARKQIRGIKRVLQENRTRPDEKPPTKNDLNTNSVGSHISINHNASVSEVKSEEENCKNTESTDSTNDDLTEEKASKNTVEKEIFSPQKEVIDNKIEKKPIHPFFAQKNEIAQNKSSNEKIEITQNKSSNEKKEGESSRKKDNASCSSSTGTEYNPLKSKYHPIDDACWKRNEKVPYLALAKTLEIIENTSARLKIIEILSNFLRSVIVLTPEDLLQSVYLCLNRLAPEYEGIELGVGETLLMKAVAQATGRTVEKIKAEVAVKGDLGLVAESSRGNQRVMFAPPKLTVSSVFAKFKEIAKMSGNAAMAKKTDKIQVLFVACRECEAKYIIRSLSGKLRIGLAEQSVIAAIARAAVLTPPGQCFPPEIINASSGMSSDACKKLLDSQTLILKTVYCECPSYDLIIPILLKEGIAALPSHCQLSPGRPLKPMLAHPTSGIDEVLRRFDNNEFTCEFKYDGERAQIHMTDTNEVKIFSRNQEDNTSKYPDVITRITKALKESTKSFILDSEAVAWDIETKQILPFQVLSTRKKKDAVESEIVVQVCIMAFDLLFLNGESLVKKPLKERRTLLHSAFNEVENEFMFVTYKDGNSAETMQEFLDESVKGNCEGLMVKSLVVDASYEIAKRSHNWLKLKKDYLEGIGDTLDLVVIGGYHGKGKRTGTYGGFLLACYDVENEEFQSICKLGTGFKEEELEAHTKFLKQHVIKEPKSYYRYDHSLDPDEWFEPVQVWEIKCADLSISPVHKAAAGIVDPEKGISLRFPRFIKIREDKKPEDATVSSQIAEMYQQQEQVQNMKNKNKKVEEDFY